jgi:hypothetical protein
MPLEEKASVINQRFRPGMTTREFEAAADALKVEWDWRRWSGIDAVPGRSPRAALDLFAREWRLITIPQQRIDAYFGDDGGLREMWLELSLAERQAMPPDRTDGVHTGEYGPDAARLLPPPPWLPPPASGPPTKSSSLPAPWPSAALRVQPGPPSNPC